MNFIAKKVLEHKIDKEDKKYIAPHFPAGVITLKEEETISRVGKIVSLYEKKGKTPERLGIFIEKMEWDKFKEEMTQ